MEHNFQETISILIITLQTIVIFGCCHTMRCSKAKKKLRQCAAVTITFVIFSFIYLWNNYCCFFPKLLKPEQYMRSSNSIISEPLNFYEATTAYTINESDASVSGRIINKFVIQSHIVVVFQAEIENFTESANRLTYFAFAEGADYFILICNNSIHFGRDMARYFVQHLKQHAAPNIGVAVAVDNTLIHTFFVVVHRSHINIFHQLFPKQLNFDDAVLWIKIIYGPYLVTSLHIQIVPKLYLYSVTYEYRKNDKKHSFKIARNKIRDHIVSHMDLMIVSYSIYGSDTRYTDGALANAELIKIVYPKWKMWLYHDNTVPLSVLSRICEMDHVTCINMEGTKFINKMSWRFLIASVGFVNRFVVRDIDSRLSARERTAVYEWINSGKSFHVMRDHPSHTKYAINGGLWGGKREVVPNMDDMLHCKINRNDYMRDMNFLNNFVWPLAKYDVYQHDSFTCQHFGGGHPFPTLRNGLEHVGSVYINGKLRKVDTDILKKTKAPKKCMRSD